MESIKINLENNLTAIQKTCRVANEIKTELYTLTVYEVQNKILFVGVLKINNVIKNIYKSGSPMGILLNYKI